MVIGTAWTMAFTKNQEKKKKKETEYFTSSFSIFNFYLFQDMCPGDNGTHIQVGSSLITPLKKHQHNCIQMWVFPEILN